MKIKRNLLKELKEKIHESLQVDYSKSHYSKLYNGGNK